MPDLAAAPAPDRPDWPVEVARLNKIIRALMDRAERSTSVGVSDFSLFQNTVLLEEQVSARTTALEAALRDNEKITRALRESEAKFQGLVSQSLVGIVIIEDGKFVYTNVKFSEMFGYSAEEGVTLHPLDIVADSDRARVAENLRKRLSGEETRGHYTFHGKRKSGDVIDIEVYSNGMKVGGKPMVISLLMDITDRTRAERELRALQEELREQATHDALTGLYNRRYLEETLRRELILAQREGHDLSVIMADLDHFKEINDRHGHLAGDEVLRVFGALMKRHARGSDVFCRWGGEEFLLVLPRMSIDSAVKRAEQLRIATVAAPVIHGATSITVTASFGVATFPRDGGNGDELTAAADRALYAAKAAGRNRVNVSSGPIKQ